MLNERISKRTNEIFWILLHALLHILYVIMKTRRACAISLLFSSYVFSRLPLVTVLLYALSCNTRVTGKKEKEKGRKVKNQEKRQNVVRCDASIPIQRKRREERFFCFLIGKNWAKERGWRGKRERKKRQGACTNHVLERLARALSMPL